MSFWDHLEELRGVLFRSVLVLFILMVVAFCFKLEVFEVVFAPLSSDFILYRLLDKLLISLRMSSIEEFNIQVQNIEMTAQFFTHVKVSLYVALVIAMPYIFYQLWTFVRPALYKNEKQVIRQTFGFAALLFYLGVAVGYYFVLPLTVRFLGTYQVSPDVPNIISLNSYISMAVSLVMILGVIFEMPILAAILSRIGLITKEMMKEYRKYAFVALLGLSAVIPPSGDAVTLFFVAIPLYCLYELSILVSRSEKYNEDVEDDIS